MENVIGVISKLDRVEVKYALHGLRVEYGPRLPIAVLREKLIQKMKAIIDKESKSPFVPLGISGLSGFGLSCIFGAALEETWRFVKAEDAHKMLFLRTEFSNIYLRLMEKVDTGAGFFEMVSSYLTSLFIFMKSITKAIPTALAKRLAAHMLSFQVIVSILVAAAGVGAIVGALRYHNRVRTTTARELISAALISLDRIPDPETYAKLKTKCNSRGRISCAWTSDCTWNVPKKKCSVSPANKYKFKPASDDPQPKARWTPQRRSRGKR